MLASKWVSVAAATKQEQQFCLYFFGRTTCQTIIKQTRQRSRFLFFSPDFVKFNIDYYNDNIYALCSPVLRYYWQALKCTMFPFLASCTDHNDCRSISLLKPFLILINKIVSNLLTNCVSIAILETHSFVFPIICVWIDRFSISLSRRYMLRIDFCHK